MNSIRRFYPLFHHFTVSKLATNSVGIATNSRNLVSSCSRICTNIGCLKLQSITFLSRRSMSHVDQVPSTHSTASPSDKIKFNVTAYATSEEYKLECMKRFFMSKETTMVKELPEDALDAICIELKTDPTTFPKGFFLFREGSVVFWNCSDEERSETLNAISRFQVAPYDWSLIEEQSETLQCQLSRNKTDLVGGNINLQSSEGTPLDHLEMLTFSNVLSHSVKLAVWEFFMDRNVTEHKSLLEDLHRGNKLKTSMEKVLMISGELYKLRHHINLGSDLLGVPDFYWDRCTLDRLYDKTNKFLSIPSRAKIINEKLSHSIEFMELIRDHLKDKHHTRLELMIIFLIMIEVVFGACHFLDKYFFNGKTHEEERSH